METPKGKILLVEDHHDIAELVYDYLESNGFTMDYASDARMALNLLADDSFDLLILDVMMPGMDGIELCQKIRGELKINVPILMLTARDTLEDKERGFKAGADDYLVKPFEIRELELRINALMRRAIPADMSESLQVEDLVLDLSTHEVTRAGKPLRISPISLRILTILMRSSPKVVPKHIIEREIWGEGLPDSDTLRSHLYNLRKAIDRDFDVQLLHTIQSTGYRLAALDNG